MSPREAGMTLLEVLVALLVLGTSVAAFLALISQNTNNTARVSENVMSRIAAENAMVDLVLADMSGEQKNAGTQTLAGITYGWEAVRSPAPVDGYDLVTVNIRTQTGGRLLASLSSFRPSEGAP